MIDRFFQNLEDFFDLLKQNPVSYLFFNRPECVKITFPVIRKHKPKKLYLIADGPRNSADEDLCIACRKYVERNIDWKCEFIKIYSDHNLGLAKRTVSAIDQIFKEEEDLIFLEDDNLVDPSFFTFCEDLLHRYKYDMNVGLIGGCNMHENAVENNYPYTYLYSAKPSAWGFATWKRAWNHMDLSMKNWNNENKTEFLKNWCYTNKHIKSTKQVFDQHCMNTDPWAWSYAWTYASWAFNLLSIIPSKNMISNVGFGPNATNTLAKYDDFVGYPPKRSSLNKLEHPPEIKRNLNYEKKCFNLEKRSFLTNFKNHISHIL
jgi:hypothetical protein